MIGVVMPTQGVVASLARPGGNVTGLTMSSPDLTQKQLELLKAALPGISRIAVIRCGGGAVSERQWHEVRTAAPMLGLQVRPLMAHGPDDVDGVVRAAVKERADALFPLSCPAIPERIADVATKQRLPTMYTSTAYVQGGGLMAHGPNLAESYRRAATYVDRGARPADLPIES